MRLCLILKMRITFDLIGYRILMQLFVFLHIFLYLENELNIIKLTTDYP